MGCGDDFGGIMLLRLECIGGSKAAQLGFKSRCHVRPRPKVSTKSPVRFIGLPQAHR